MTSIKPTVQMIVAWWMSHLGTTRTLSVRAINSSWRWLLTQLMHQAAARTRRRCDVLVAPPRCSTASPIKTQRYGVHWHLLPFLRVLHHHIEGLRLVTGYLVDAKLCFFMSEFRWRTQKTSAGQFIVSLDTAWLTTLGGMIGGLSCKIPWSTFVCPSKLRRQTYLWVAYSLKEYRSSAVVE